MNTPLDPAVVKRIQERVGCKPDGVLGDVTLAAIDETLAELEQHLAGQIAGLNPTAAATLAAAPRVLHGDGTWPFTATIEGADIVLRNVKATCFGGASDPQDNGDTASGISTKKNPSLEAVSLPLDGRQFAKLSPAEHRALDGSPIPRMPWGTDVEVTIGDKTILFEAGLVDLGPGKQATHPGSLPHALDLTVAAARRFDPRASATNFSATAAKVRIIGAAQYAQA